MQEFVFKPRITREYILSFISEEEIFERYGVQVQKGLFKSPLRVDRSPTCLFYRSRRANRLFLRDWAGHFHGDCFDLVAFQHNLNNFNSVLNRVAVDFNLTDGPAFNPQRVPQQSMVKIDKQSCDIRVKRREWTRVDREFWNRWDFKDSTLELYHTQPIDKVWINGELIYAYNYINVRNVAYVYHFGDYDYKVYFPRRERNRFIQNNAEILQGYLQLPPVGEFCIITKSMKDVMKLYEFGIAAVAPMSESQMFSNDMYNDLKERFGKLFVLYDNDMAGKKATIRWREHYPDITALLMPKGYPKDFTDFYERRGLEKTLALIETLKAQLL